MRPTPNWHHPLQKQEKISFAEKKKRKENRCMFELKLEMLCACFNANPTDKSKMKVKARF